MPVGSDGSGDAYFLTWPPEGEDPDCFALCDVGRCVDTTSPVSAAPQPHDAMVLASELLGNSGLSFGNVCRTWFYLDDFLSWCGELSLARNEGFTLPGLLDDGRAIIRGSSQRTD